MESKPAGHFRFRPLAKVRLLVLLSFFSGLSQTLLAAAPGVEGRWACGPGHDRSPAATARPRLRWSRPWSEFAACLRCGRRYANHGSSPLLT